MHAGRANRQKVAAIERIIVYSLCERGTNRDAVWPPGSGNRPGRGDETLRIGDGDWLAGEGGSFPEEPLSSDSVDLAG